MAGTKRDFYEVLGVSKDVRPDELKKAYRRQAHRFHPDRNPDDPESETKFKEAAEAFEILSDSQKKERYDRFGHAGLSGAGVHDFSHMNVDDIFSMFGDVFGGVFGGGRRRSRGTDLQTEVELSLREVATGATRTIEFSRQDLCDSCNGSGAAPGSQRQACGICGGYGQVEQSGGLGGLFGRVITDCPNCHGQGSKIVTPCTNCRGSGRTVKHRELSVQIPAGIHDGQAVRVRGEGEPGEDGRSRGDLHCYVRIKGHPFLKRHNNDLVCTMPVSFTQASLGAKVEVPTLTGKADLKIPAGTQHGQIFRLRGLGVPDIRTGRTGDEMVQVLIEIPKKLDKKQQELLREFAKSENRTVLPESRGFFDKLVDYLGSQGE